MKQTSQILIIEDDLAFLKMMKVLLEQQGLVVFEAKSLKAGLKILEAEPAIKCVIQDLGLPPKPNSIEAGLKSMGEILSIKPWLKIIVLTGQDKHDAAKQAIKQGAFDFLQKPVSMDGLLAAIDRALLFFNTEKDLTSQGHYSVQVNSGLESSGLKGMKEGVELNLLKRVLEEEGYNIAQTASCLGIRRENLYYLFRKHGIDPEWVHKMNSHQ